MSNGYYGQYQKQTQSQTVKQQGLTDQQKKQHMVHDMCGRVFAEMEALLIESRIKNVDQRHQSYLGVEHDSKRNRLLNIQNFIMGLTHFMAPKVEKGIFTDKKIPSPYKLPIVDPAWVNNIWKCASQLGGNDVAFKVIDFVCRAVSGEKTLEALPTYLSDEIMSSKDRQNIAEEVCKNNQYSALQMMDKADHVMNTVGQKLNSHNIQPAGDTLSNPLFEKNQMPPKKYYDDPTNDEQYEEKQIKQKFDGF
jgi:hypothetical protein